MKSRETFRWRQGDGTIAPFKFPLPVLIHRFEGYIFAVRPPPPIERGTEYTQHSRSRREIRLFSSGLQTDFGFLQQDPPPPDRGLRRKQIPGKKKKSTTRSLTYFPPRSSWSLLLSFFRFKYIRRDSILFGGLVFVVAPDTVTRSGSESTPYPFISSLFSLNFFHLRFFLLLLDSLFPAIIFPYSSCCSSFINLLFRFFPKHT